MHPRHPFVLAPALAALLAAACAEPEPTYTGETNDLLHRRPDRIEDQPGRILPGPEDPWGDLGLVGWRRITQPEPEPGEERPADALLHARTDQPRAVLVLPATTPAKRTVELVVWSPQATEENPVRVTVTLNGVGNWRLSLAPEPRTERIEVDADAWVEGDNHLGLEVEARDGDWPDVHLARVDYGEPRSVAVDLEAGRLHLEPGTGATYAIELRQAARLELAGDPGSSRGTLRLRERRLPRDGGEPFVTTTELRIDGPFWETSRLEPTLDGERCLRLELELTWLDATGPLEVVTASLREAELRQRPPVVFVSIDTFAARHLSLYGYGRETTPVLDALASESVVFDRCYVNAPWTMPSYMSVMTGLYPQAHKLDVVQPTHGDPLPAYSSWQLAEQRWTLAETFRALGYRTAGFVDTDWLRPRFRFDQGFDLYDLEPALIGLEDPLGGLAYIHYKLANQWLDAGAPGQPPFLFVHALDSHGPYWPGDPWLDHFHRDPPAEGWAEVPAGSAFQTYRSIPYWMAGTLWRNPADIPEHTPIEPIVDRYDDTLLKVDEYLGKIFDELRARDLFDEALVVVSGDHGESFDHDFYGHGTMWEDVLLVPLLIKLPGAAHGGTRIDAPVQLTDLYPTLRELVGLEPLPGGHGSSLVPLLEGAAGGGRTLYGSEGHCEQYFVSDGRWKLVVEHPGRLSQRTSLLTHPEAAEWVAQNYPELVGVPLTPARFKALERTPDFGAKMAELRALLDGPFVRLVDLQADPDERRNVADEHPEIVARLTRALEHERAREESARLTGALIAPPPPLDPEARAHLEALGYVGSDDD